jgi:hypothetical protein
MWALDDRGLWLNRPREFEGTFEDLARMMEATAGYTIDHFHATDPEGEVLIIRVTDSSGYTRYLTPLGWRLSPCEFDRVIGHRFHGPEYAPRVELETDTYDPDAPVRREGGFTRFMKRLVSW